MCRPGKSMLVILALAAVVLLGGLSQAFADEVLFNFGPPAEKINGYQVIRSNGATSPDTFTSSPDSYRIPGDNFTIGAAGQQYHIDQITLYILGGKFPTEDPNGPYQYDKTTPLSPPMAPLNVLVGPQNGTMSSVASSYNATRVYYENSSDHALDQNYQRLSDGAWRGAYQLDFNTNFTVSGGQTYYFFLNGLMGNPSTGPWNQASLVGANVALGAVTDKTGFYDNTFYWYYNGTITPETAGFYPADPLYLNGDLHVAIRGTLVATPIPGSLLLLSTGLMGLGALRWRRRRG